MIQEAKSQKLKKNKLIRFGSFCPGASLSLQLLRRGFVQVLGPETNEKGRGQVESQGGLPGLALFFPPYW